MSAELMNGEQIIARKRQHWSVVAPALVASAIVTVAALVGVALLPSTVGGHDINAVRAIVAVVVVILAVVSAGTRYLRWRCRTYLLTDRRVVLEAGILSRSVQSIALDRIQNTVIQRPLGDRVIGAGDIEIESAGRDGVERLERIPGVQHFYTELLQAIDGWRQGQPSGGPRVSPPGL